MARRSLRSSNNSPSSSASLKAMFKTPSWALLSCRSLVSKNGPISEMVVRSGWPCSPAMSQNSVGKPWGVSSPRPTVRARSLSLASAVAGRLVPDKSPLTSAKKTGTPRLDKPSASTFTDTVLPVPVAPAINPWRFASCNRSCCGVSPLPTNTALSECMILGSQVADGRSQGRGRVTIMRYSTWNPCVRRKCQG